VVNRTNVNVQELAVTAALTGRKEHVYHAAHSDPLTGDGRRAGRGTRALAARSELIALR
jgi:alpha-galactosidase/6-phospho-beta-glucosidase family protein